MTLTVSAGTGSTFAGWSGACSGTGICSVTMSQARAVTATFNTTPVQFTLTVGEAGTGSGTVSSSPSGISCPTTCSANYNSGTPVTLTATAGTGSTFAGWSGACSGTGSCSVTMSAAQSVTAMFNSTPVQFALTVTEAGTGSGTVTSSPSGISCPTTCSANYNSGTPVTLTAAPGTGSTFTGWSGACSGAGSCSVTMSQARAVTATFNTTPVQFALTVSEAGTGSGSVSSTPSGISCPTTCSANYNSGTPVTLTAIAGTGSTFAGWSGACSGTGSCSVTMSQARAVTAMFNTMPVQFALTVTETGTGTGTVMSSPVGISCPSTCSANYNSGTGVTLTAAAGTGSTFAGWSGPCSGTGSCSVTMSQARALTAAFTGSGTESPAISATIINRGWSSSTVLFVDLQLKNTGTGISLHTVLTQVAPTTTGGTGTVTYNTALSPALPIAAGTIGKGGAFTVRLYLNVPSTVTKLILTESGSMNSSTGTALSYVQSQTLNR